MTTVEYVFHEGNTTDEVQRRLKQNPGFKWLRNYVWSSHNLWMFRPIFWVVAAGMCLVMARRCRPASRRYVTALSLSSLVYLGTYFFVGVASNFRYAYWAVLATSTCILVLICELAEAIGRHRLGVMQSGPPRLK
jgi:hypothetical protein